MTRADRLWNKIRRATTQAGSFAGLPGYRDRTTLQCIEGEIKEALEAVRTLRRVLDDEDRCCRGCPTCGR